MRTLKIALTVGLAVYVGLAIGAWLRLRDPTGLLFVQPASCVAGEVHAADYERARGFVVGGSLRK